MGIYKIVSTALTVNGWASVSLAKLPSRSSYTLRCILPNVNFQLVLNTGSELRFSRDVRVPGIPGIPGISKYFLGFPGIEECRSYIPEKRYITDGWNGVMIVASGGNSGGYTVD